VTRLDLADLEEVYALRRLLETEALVRGVPRATRRDLAALRAAVLSCEEAGRRGDVTGRLRANRSFHDLLHGLAGSRPLTRLIDLLWDSTEAYRALYYSLPGETDEVDAAHHELLAAVSARDAARAVAVQDVHRERALTRLREAIDVGL
jgi:DNA-binding GntR family transcriptional regulator